MTKKTETDLSIPLLKKTKMKTKKINSMEKKRIR